METPTPIALPTLPKLTVAFCIPVLNDWESASILADNIRKHTKFITGNKAIIFVDDGSISEEYGDLESSDDLFIYILRLKRNLGHQRAIAIGLSAIAATVSTDFVVVMDGDGEDMPEHVASLIEAATLPPHPIVFAKRTRRSEGWLFRMGYIAFKSFHRVLTGRGCDIGNFSVIPAKWLARLTCTTELWIHYSAAVTNSRIPILKRPCARGRRYCGNSKMKGVSLVVHGLSAIAVLGETVGVRLFLFLCFSALATCLAILAVIYLRFFTTLAIPVGLPTQLVYC